MRITVLTGGSTPERDVALAGAAQVVAALRERQHAVTVVDTVTGPVAPDDETTLLDPHVGAAHPTLVELSTLAAREDFGALLARSELRDTDLVFCILHGKQGEGGEVQALLELAGVPYTGSGPLGSALAMDKDVAKRLFLAANVPTPAWRMWPAPDAGDALGFPLVVKPSKAGSTVGLTVIESPEELALAVEHARQYDDEVMLEQFLDGREFTVGILGDRPLAVGEIVPQHAIFDYECKYTPGMTQEIFPADIPASLADDMRRLALDVHRALKLRDFSRVDFRIDGQGSPQCLEVNTLPGLTATSLLPQSAAAVGIPFAELCESICREALQRVDAGRPSR